jgi:hypothetical protein
MLRAAAAACLLSSALLLGGCQTAGDALTSFSNWATNADAQVKKYAPVVGKALIALDDIVYQVECSPGMPAASQTAANILSIVAPNSTAADKFQTRVQQNDDIADQLCPLVNQIKIDVGNVPAGTPAEVIVPTAN